jgi:hypothetical protein
MSRGTHETSSLQHPVGGRLDVIAVQGLLGSHSLEPDDATGPADRLADESCGDGNPERGHRRRRALI